MTTSSYYAPGPFNFRSRADFAADRLKMAILRGELQPGERVIPSALCELWGISQTPMREAFQRLVASGLVELEDHKGAKVASISAADCEDLIGLRSMLEGRALRESLAAADDTWRESAELWYERLSETLTDDILEDAGKLAAFNHAHQNFHLAMLGGCSSHWLVHTIKLLMDNSLRYRMRRVQPRGGAASLLAEHEALLQAALQNRSEDLVRLNHDHLWRTVTLVRELSSDDTSSSIHSVAANET